MSSAPVFLVDDVATLPGPAGITELAGPEGRHAATVRRIRPGEPVVLTDGRGGVAHAETTAARKESLELRITGLEWVPPPRVRITVAQALVKGDRGELAVQTATEAGADELIPWRAARCVARWEAGPRGDRALARWRATVREAAKQARRAWAPVVDAPAATADLSRRVPEFDLAVVLHESAQVSLASLSVPAEGSVLLVVGPEGGIDERELDTLVAAGATAVRLGPEVLRASTAACVALGALGVLTGRWAATVT